MPQAYGIPLVLLAVACAVVRAAGLPPLSVRSVQPSRTELGRFETIEFDLDVASSWENPFDPDQIDIQARFIAPSGRALSVPAFWHRPFRSSVRPATEQRRRVAFLKFFIEELEWGPGTEAEFFLDEVTLRDSRTGRSKVIGDAEGEGAAWGPAELAAVSDELARGGRRSVRFAVRTDEQESWPGAVLACSDDDWSAWDGLSLWVYPRVAAMAGPVYVYFQNDEGRASPVMRWGAGEMRPNEWNRLEWDWSDFRPDLEFEPAGEPGWKVRFTPVEEGRYRYYVTATDGRSQARSPEGEFTVSPSDGRGFVRISADDPHYFAFDNGEPFFPIGHDVGWSEAGGALSEALAYFPKMQAHGEDCTYLMMHALPAFPPILAIEWNELGVYDLKTAAQVDWYVDLAAKHGIYLKLSFDVHAHNVRHGRTALWPDNPYNAERGGPCQAPNDFFTDATAREFYKKRMRYIVARYGHERHVMAWETFAEIDGATELDGQAGWGYPGRPGGERVSAMLVDWLRDTSACLRSIDPYDRLITASFSGDTSDPNVWRMPEIQYTQIHHYDSLDTAAAIGHWCRSLTEAYAKPMMVTEFGWEVAPVDRTVDPQGICLHNGIWASVMTGAAGSALNWWCWRIDQLDLYHHFAALRAFVQGIDWPREGFRAADVELTPPDPPHPVPVTVPARGPFSGARVSEFTVRNDGSVNDPYQVPAFLHAPGRPERGAAPVFHVDCPTEGTFAVHVHSVCPDARLDLYLDGELALSKELPARDVEGKTSTFSDQWQVWQCTYDEDFAIQVPAGPHTIRLENGEPGFSWIRISHYTLSDYDEQPVRAFGLAGRNTVLLWLQDKESTWGNDARGLRARPITGAKLIVAASPDGPWTVEWWDTYSGAMTGTQDAEAAGGRIVLAVPPFERDVACKIRRKR